MEVDGLPTVNANEVNNEMSVDKTQSIHTAGPTATDLDTEKTPHNKEGVNPFSILQFPIYSPSATSSKSKYNNASIDIEKKKMQEFIRILRPHLPRKSKSRAYKMLQNIAKGTVPLVKSSFQQRIRRKKPKQRPARKQRAQQLKKLAKSLSIMRRSNHSVYSSSDSCQSNSSCPHCGYSCSRIARC